MVNTAGEITHYRFQFGRSKRYGRTSSGRTLAAGSKQVRVVIKITKLRPRTTYHYRVVATNATGTTYGKDMTFRTRERPANKHAG
jgi:phosphodiesterase/alkaline phosphatase D-like protein